MDKLIYTSKKSPSINIDISRFQNKPLQKKTSYVGGDRLKFRVPGNMANTFLDNNYGLMLKGKINLQTISTDAVVSTFDLVLDKPGAASCIKDIYINIGGVTIPYEAYNINQCNISDLESNPLYRANTGLLLEGTTAYAEGTKLQVRRQADGSVSDENAPKSILEFCIPLHTILSTDQLIPLFGSAPIEIEIVLEDAGKIGAYQYTQTDGPDKTITNDIVTYTDIELQGQYIIFSDQAFNAINNMHGGLYELHATNWYHSQDTIDAGTKQFVSQINATVSSMKRILICHRNSDLILSNGRTLAQGVSTESLSLGHHINDLKQWHIELDNVSYPNTPVKNMTGTTYGGPMFYELMNADDKFGVVSSGCSLGAPSGWSEAIEFSHAPFNLDQTATGTPYVETAHNIGSYLSGFNFEVMNHGKSRSMRDGLSTIGSDFNYHATFNTAATNDVVIDYFVQADVKLILDTRGSNVMTYIS